MRNLTNIVETQRVEIKKLESTIQEAETEKQSQQQKGESQFRERLDEVAAYRENIARLRRELHASRTQVVNIEGLKREVRHHHKELLQERSKCKALSEELENPMNVHRWRKLEGSDPAAYEMIQKVKTLQKRLIAKTEEVVEKDLLIQEKEKLYLELKSILARQPGPEVREQLEMYEDNLQAK